MRSRALGYVRVLWRVTPSRSWPLAAGAFFRRFALRDEGNQTAAARILSPPPINWPGQARLRATFVTTRQSHKRGCTIARWLRKSLLTRATFRHRPDSRFFAVYDNATILRSKGAYALDASIMSLSPGGKQRKQRDTTYTDLTTKELVRQSLVDTDGVAKGLLAILRERGEQWTKSPSKKQAVAMLNKYDDFKDQSSWIERIFRASACGHRMIFAPKCHPELQYAIESSWAKMKGYIRRQADWQVMVLSDPWKENYSTLKENSFDVHESRCG